MRILIDKIPTEGMTLQADIPPDNFPGLRDISVGTEARFTAPVRINLLAMRAGSFVSVTGTLEASVGLACSRCLREFSTRLRPAFEAFYTDRQEPVTPAAVDEEETGLDPETIGLFYFKGKEIDLSTAIEEHLILALPIKPLCEDDCKGLCPRCGANRNTTVCDCDNDNLDPRFAVLKKLKKP